MEGQPKPPEQARAPGQPEPPGKGQPPRAPQPPGKPQPPEAQKASDPQRRIDGLRSWLAQVERRLGVRSYIGAALAILALAAAGAAIYLALTTKEDAATDADVQNLREELTGVRESAADAAQQDVQTINEMLADLEDQIGKLKNDQGSFEDELSVARDDIQDLRDQISDLETGNTGAGGNP
jgi:predicted RNase H-like nuclease (RuvC/YqgF family)